MFRRTPSAQSPIGPIISQIVSRLAQNPEVQRQVKRYAAEAGRMTARASVQAKEQWKQHVQPKINQMSAAASAGSASNSKSSSQKSSSSQSSSSAGAHAKSGPSMWEQFSSAADKFKASQSANASSSSSKASYSSSSSSGGSNSTSSSSGKQGSAWTPEMRFKAFMGRVQQRFMNIPNMMQQRAQNYWNNFNMSRDFMMVMMCMQVLSGIFGLLFHQGTDKQGAHGQARKIQEQRIAEEKAAQEKKKQEDAIKNKDTLKEEMQVREVTRTSKLAQIASESTMEGSQLSYGSGGDSPITVFQREQQQLLQQGQKQQRRGRTAEDDDPFAGTWWVSKNPPVHNPNIGIHQREGVTSTITTPAVGNVVASTTAVAQEASSAGGFDSNFQMTSVTFGEAKEAHVNPAHRGYDPLPPRQAYGEAEGVKPWFAGATQRRLNH